MKQKNNLSNRGLAPIITLIIAAGIIAAGIGGYVFINKKSTLSISSQCKYKDPDLCKFLNRSVAAPTVSTSMTGRTISQFGGKKMETMWETEGSKKTRVVTYIDGKESFQTIMIDGKTYVKDYSDNSWYTQALPNDTKFPMGEMSKQISDDLQKEALETQYKKVGKEQCGNLTCYKYQVVDASGTNTKTYLFFDTNEYLLRRIVNEDATGGVADTTITYGKVTITEPSPVKNTPRNNTNMINDLIQQQGQNKEDLQYLKDFEQEMKKALDEGKVNGAQEIAIPEK